MRTAAIVVTVAALAACASASPRFYRQPCSGPEDFRLADARDYRGFVNRTATGLLCQPWASVVPHPHQTPIDPSLGTSGADNNYCRNPLPAAHDGAWCYTMSAAVPYQRCDIGRLCDPSRAGQVEAVVIDPVAARQPSPMTVSLTCATLGADIFVSTDGTDPAPSDESLYAGPFVLSGGGMRPVRAVAYKDGMRASTVAVRAFALELPPLGPVGILPVPPSARHIYGAPVLVSLQAPVASTAADGSAVGATAPAVDVYYTLDGSSPSLTSRRYTGSPFWVKENTVVRAVAIASGLAMSTPSTQAYSVSAPPAPMPQSRPVVETGAIVYGAVEFALTSAVTEPEYLVSVNGSARMTIAEAMRITAPGARASGSVLRVSLPGTIELSIVVSGRDTGFSAPVTMRFTINPMPRVEILPRGGAYHGPVEVTVTLASGAASSPVPIIVTVDGVPRYGATTFTLSGVGPHTVEAYTQSFADRGVATTSIFDLSPLQLLPPAVQPDPEASVWAGFLFVSPLVLTLPETFVRGVTYEITIASASQGASRVERVTGAATSSIELAAPTGSAVESFVVELRALPTDANSTFLIPSARRSLTLRVAPFGSAATPFFRLNLAADPTASDCNGLARRINAALFLTSSAGVGAQAVIHRCARRPAFRITGLPVNAVSGYTRWILADLAKAPQGNSAIYTAAGGAASNAAPVAAVDARVFVDGCSAVSTELYFAPLATGSPAASLVSPATCGANCLAATNAASVLLADGGRCACLNTVTAPGVGVDAPFCATPCAADLSSTCGGPKAFSTTTLATHYGVINTTSGSSAALFPILYGFVVTTAGTISTSGTFDIRLEAANLPDGASSAGSVKFITESQTCASLAPDFTFAPDGVVRGVLLRRAATYRVCATLLTSAGTDDAGVFRELAPLAGGAQSGITVVLGEDVPVTVTPGSGVLVAPASITVACDTAGAQLVVTLDQDAPVVVAGPSYTFTVRTLGSHLVSAHATTGGNAIGMPISRAYTVVDASSLTTTAAPLVTFPPLPSGVAGPSASTIGVQGYTFALTTARRTQIRLALDEASWRASACGGVAVTEPCVVYVTADGRCGNPATVPAALASTLQRSASADSYAFEAATAIDLLAAFPMTRDALRVCVGVPAAGAASEALEAAPLEPSWQLTAAAQGVGLCSKAQAALCTADSRCAARTAANDTQELVCLCKPAPASTAAELSVFCTDMAAAPEELRGAKNWNGTTAITLGTPAPGIIAVAEGSYGSLLLLIIIFGASTGILCYVKRRPHPSVTVE